MPAVQLARLRHQTAELAEYFFQPETLVRKLSDLFEFYADRTQRPNQPGKIKTMIKAYTIPQPVLRRVELELEPFIDPNPQAALNLIDALWEQKILEFRLLAIDLLGKFPPAMLYAINDRVQQWNQENDEEILMTALARQGMARLQAESQSTLLQLIDILLKTGELKQQRFGLQALHLLLTEGGFENLPAVYRYLSPTIENPPKGLRPYLIDVIRPLAQQSPQETAFFLRQSLSKSKSPTLVRIIRRSLEEFPDDIQKSLRLALKDEK